MNQKMIVKVVEASKEFERVADAYYGNKASIADYNAARVELMQAIASAAAESEGGAE